MRPNQPAPSSDTDLFRHRLDNMLDQRHELYQLANLIDWQGCIPPWVVPAYVQHRQTLTPVCRSIRLAHAWDLGPVFFVLLAVSLVGYWGEKIFTCRPDIGIELCLTGIDTDIDLGAFWCIHGLSYLRLAIRARGPHDYSSYA